MRAGYASSLSAFSGDHPQWSSTPFVTISSPTPRTGITNAGLVRATSPVAIKRWLKFQSMGKRFLNSHVQDIRAFNFYIVYFETEVNTLCCIGNGFL